MKKYLKVCACTMAAFMLFTGCSKKAATDNATESTTSGEAVVETSGTEATPSDSEKIFETTGVKEDSVTLGEYKGIEMEGIKVEITDEQVDAEIDSIINGQVHTQEVDRAAKEGDIVNIDFVGMRDGVPFDGGTGTGTDLELGSKRFIEGFEEKLVGAKKGEERSLDLTFPEDYHQPDLAGAAVVFDVTVNSVSEKITPKLDDEFVKKESETSKTVAEYREEIRKMLEEDEKAQKEEFLKTEIFMKALENSEIIPSDESIETFYNKQLIAYNDQAAAFGLELKDLLAFQGMDLETFQHQIRAASSEGAKQTLLMNAISEKEKLEVTEEDKEKLAEELGYESAEAMITAVGETAVIDYLTADKVLNFLYENAVIK